MAIVVGRNWGVEKLPKKPGRFEIKIINQRKLTCSFSKRLDKVSPAIFSLHPLILNLVYYSFNKVLMYRRKRERKEKFEIFCFRSRKISRDKMIRKIGSESLER